MTAQATEDRRQVKAPSRFDSLAAMQERHSALVKEIGNDVLAPGNPDKIAAFVARGVATGSVLDAREDRAAAQALINFWISRLSSAASEARRASASGTISSPPSSGPEIEDTLLEEFDPETIACATQDADRWLQSLSEDDRALVRKIMLRLVRLSGQGEAFEPVSATRASLEELDPSPAAVEKLVAGLAARGIIRVTPGNTPETDLVSVRGNVMEQWQAFRRWQGERLRFRASVIEWDRSGQSKEALVREESLEEGRGYNDRNPLERKFIELSRREEIWRTRRDQERGMRYRLAAVVLGVGALMTGLMAYQWYRNAMLAGQETERAKEASVRAEQESARAEQGFMILQDKHKLTTRFEVARALTEIARTLAGVGTGSVAERKIAFQRLDALRELLSDDPEVKRLLADDRLAGLRARTEAESEEDIRMLESLTLGLATTLKEQIVRAAEKDYEKGEVNRALTQERAVLFRSVRFCAEQIAQIAQDSNASYHDADPYLKEFWGLYWGEMGVVEKDQVRGAMIDFGNTLKAIDQRLIDRIRLNDASTKYLKDPAVLKGLTNRQAIQGYYEAAREVVKSSVKPDDLTRIRLDPKKDHAILDSLRTNLEALKQALKEEESEPFA
jgi:hypothetical protein